MSVELAYDMMAEPGAGCDARIPDMGRGGGNIHAMSAASVQPVVVGVDGSFGGFYARMRGKSRGS